MCVMCVNVHRRGGLCRGNTLVHFQPFQFHSACSGNNKTFHYEPDTELCFKSSLTSCLWQELVWRKGGGKNASEMTVTVKYRKAMLALNKKKVDTERIKRHVK